VPDIVHILLLFGVGGLAGFVNIMAGGGSALVLPLLIFIGLDPGTANGTNRVAVLIQNISASATFRSEGIGDFGQSAKYGLCVVPGAVVGALAAVQIPDLWFERILGVVMIGVVISMLVPRRDASAETSGHRSLWIYPALFGIGFYGGFIQVGVGFLFLAIFFHLLHMDLVRSTVHKVLIILIYSIPSLLVFALAGKVAWLPGLALAAGNATGAWIAARAAVRKGEKIVRFFLIVAILGMAAKIILDAI